MGKKDKGLCWLFFSQVQEDLLHISSLLLLPRNIVVRCIVVLWIQLVDGWILSFPEMRTQDWGLRNRTTNSRSNGRIICHQCGVLVLACLHFLSYVFMRSKSVYITLKNIRKSGYTGVPTSIFAKVKASGSLGMHNPNLVKPKFVSSWFYISYGTF